MRQDKIIPLAALMALAALATVNPVRAQNPGPTYGHEPGKIPLSEVTVGYAYLHANAPPGQCGCFSANGGFGSIVVNAPHGISGVADFTVVHASNISGTSQSVWVDNYLFGPRYTIRSATRRVAPYGQALFGISTEETNYNVGRNLRGFAFSLGGGLNVKLQSHLAWNAVELNWVHSQVPNSSNNRQNDLTVRTGITARF